MQTINNIWINGCFDVLHRGHIELFKYAKFDGRASKSEFWWFQLFYVIVLIVGMILDSLLGYTELFYWIGYIICLLPGLAVGCRRLHDTNRTGWWQLLSLTIIGIIVLIVWWVADSDNRKNRYGPALKK